MKKIVQIARRYHIHFVTSKVSENSTAVQIYTLLNDEFKKNFVFFKFFLF